jgi:hypothetical protein
MGYFHENVAIYGVRCSYLDSSLLFLLCFHNYLLSLAYFPYFENVKKSYEIITLSACM